MTLYPPNLPEDKANHFVWGSIIYAVSLMLTKGNHNDSMLTVCVCAGAKEAVDWVLNFLAIRRGTTPPYHVEGLDAVATVAGGAVQWVAAHVVARFAVAMS